MAEKVDFGPRVGADPELFLIAKKGEEFAKNTVVPVFGKFGGTKTDPIKVKPDQLAKLGFITKWDPNCVGGFAYQEDNAAFEFNIPAASTSEHFSQFINGFLAWADTTLLTPLNLMFAYNLSQGTLFHYRLSSTLSPK